MRSANYMAKKTRKKARLNRRLVPNAHSAQYTVFSRVPPKAEIRHYYIYNIYIIYIVKFFFTFFHISHTLLTRKLYSVRCAHTRLFTPQVVEQLLNSLLNKRRMQLLPNLGSNLLSKLLSIYKRNLRFLLVFCSLIRIFATTKAK